jgi:hypothetical protein
MAFKFLEPFDPEHVSPPSLCKGFEPLCSRDDVGQKQKDGDEEILAVTHGSIMRAYASSDRSKLWDPWLFSMVKRYYHSKVNNGAVSLTAAANGLPVGPSKEATADLLLKYQVFPLSLPQLRRIMDTWEELSEDEQADLAREIPESYTHLLPEGPPNRESSLRGDSREDRKEGEAEASGLQKSLAQFAEAGHRTKDPV